MNQQLHDRINLELKYQALITLTESLLNQLDHQGSVAVLNTDIATIGRTTLEKLDKIIEEHYTTQEERSNSND